MFSVLIHPIALLAPVSVLKIHENSPIFWKKCIYNLVGDNNSSRNGVTKIFLKILYRHELSINNRVKPARVRTAERSLKNLRRDEMTQERS